MTKPDELDRTRAYNIRAAIATGARSDRRTQRGAQLRRDLDRLCNSASDGDLRRGNHTRGFDAWVRVVKRFRVGQ